MVVFKLILDILELIVKSKGKKMSWIFLMVVLKLILDILELIVKSKGKKRSWVFLMVVFEKYRWRGP